MENLLLPSQVEFIKGSTKNTGTLLVSPCYHGYGTTLGNSLRRVLLSSLPGAAVEGFKIKGVQHEFSSAEGIKEDVVEIIMNLKQLTIKTYSDDPVVLTISKKEIGKVYARDIKKDSNVEIVNPDQVICELTSKKEFEMEIIVGRGRGFKPAEEKDRKNYDLGTILIDSIYTPIKDVGYKVDYTRVGDITNFERLTVDIETDGTLTPEDAVFQSTKILMDHYTLIVDAIGNLDHGKKIEVESSPEEETVSAEEDEPAKEEKEEGKAKTKKAAAKKKK